MIKSEFIQIIFLLFSLLAIKKLLPLFWEEESKLNFCKKSSKFPKPERLILEESLNGNLCDEESDSDSLEENEEKPPLISAS